MKERTHKTAHFLFSFPAKHRTLLYIHQPLLSGPALHPQVRLIIPSPAPLSWGACCQFIRLFLLISYFPQCKHHLRCLQHRQRVQSEAVRNRLTCSPQTDREKQACDGVMISWKEKQYCTHSLQSSLYIFHILVYIEWFLVSVVLKCWWSGAKKTAFKFNFHSE